MSRSRELLSRLTTGLLVACALLITGLVVRRELFGPAPAAAESERRVADWRQYAAEGSVMGPADAPVKIVTFSDFQCPFCATANAEIERARALDPARVAVVYRHLPLEAIHPHAFEAALAVECAGEQGRFESYHDALFAAQNDIGVTRWREFAERAGVADLDGFDRCVREQRFGERVRRDLAVARDLGIDGTPTYLFDGRMVFGVPGAQKLVERVRAALAE